MAVIEAGAERGQKVTPEQRVVRVAGMAFGVTSSTHATHSEATFVLVHGIGTSHRYMDRLHGRLAAHGDVFSIDLPGFGGMPKPAASGSVSVMARALGELLTRLGAEHAVLIGHSMGSQWVTELAAQRPALASSVVLIGPVADNEHRSVFAQSVALGRDILGEPPDANVSVSVDYVRCGPAWYTRQLRFMIAYSIEQRVAMLTMPVLIVRGGNDPIAGLAWCRRLRDCAPIGTLVVIPGHRHVVQFTAPRAVASAIRAYMVGSSDPRAAHRPSAGRDLGSQRPSGATDRP